MDIDQALEELTDLALDRPPSGAMCGWCIYPDRRPTAEEERPAG